MVDLGEPDPEPVVVLDPSAGWGGVKPVFSPDGRRLTFICHMTDEADDGLCLMNADGSGIAPLVDDPVAFENHPAWGSRPADASGIQLTTAPRTLHGPAATLATTSDPEESSP